MFLFHPRESLLFCVVEDGVKFVIIDAGAAAVKPAVKRAAVKKTPLNDDRYYKLLEEQNVQLHKRVETLEGETRTLRDQKEQMLISEREKIEQIYKDKDEQLKNILNAISTKFIMNSPDEASEPDENVVEAEIEQVNETHDSRLISLKKYIKSKDFSKKKVLKIKEKFEKKAKTDSRIITIGKKIYIDLQKYDYSDFML